MRLAATFAALLLSATAAGAQTNTTAPDSTQAEPSLFFDSEDGQFDISGFLASKKGFLPIGSVITEPAVGYGGALGLMFLHDSIEDRMEQARIPDADGRLRRLAPPSMTGVAGFLTENGSWGAGAGHKAILLDDDLRSTTGFFYSGLKLDYYGPGGSFDLPIDKIGYSLDGYVFMQEIMSRVADSDVFIGLNYKYMSFESKLDIVTDLELPEMIPQSFETTLGAAGMAVEYDTRNTTFTPDVGINGRTELTFFQKALGGDRDFFKSYVNLRGWIPVGRRIVMGLRSDTQFSDGATPFYMLPSVDMRGISLTRYQGQYTTAAEVEVRWDITRRWSALGFLGSGWVAANEMNDFKLDEGHFAGGAGFRYHLSRVFGIRSGVDFAWSEDDFAFYIVNGTAWGRK